jgi:hypothetical protein
MCIFFTYGFADPVIVIYSKSEEGKAFVAIQVNESGLTLEYCIWFSSLLRN